MRKFPSEIKRIVIKVSTQMITDGVAKIYYDKIQKFVQEISNLIKSGYEVIIVSSGAIGCGLAKLGLEERPKNSKELQAIASVGQIYLAYNYQQEFAKHKINVGQILLSADDTKNSIRRTNVRNTLEVLLQKGIVPIINENDTVAIEELKYGDNDTLSALVSILLYVDLLIILTDVEGLCDRNPKLYPNYSIISQVDVIDDTIEKLVEDIDEGITFGGMKSKINAVKKLSTIGIPVIITSFNKSDVLDKIINGHDIGTYFLIQK